MSNQGNTKLIDKNGFEYIKNRAFSKVTHWRCSKHRKGSCKGKAQTRQFGSKHMMKVYGVHNHYMSDEGNEVFTEYEAINVHDYVQY